MDLLTFNVLLPFNHNGAMVTAGTVSLTLRAASHLLAGGKIEHVKPTLESKQKGKK